MPSLKFPDNGTRMAVYGTGRPAAGAASTFYADAACTILAEVYLDVAGVKGALIADATITRDQYGQCPDLWGPVAGTDRLYVRTNGVTAIVDADYNGRLDVLEAQSLPLASGRWRLSTGGPSATGTHALGFERAQLLRVPPGTALQAIAINVATVGSGSVVRLGARADTAAGTPGALLADFGTVDSSGSTGLKPLAISFTVPLSTGLRGLYVTATAQGGVAPVLTCRGAVGNDYDFSDATLASSAPGCYVQSGVTGVLPTTFTGITITATATAIAVQGS